MKSQSIFFIGECMVELQRAGTSMQYQFGGDTLNAAIYLARLIDPAQVDVAYVSAIGTDTLSDEMHTLWQQEGIATEWVQRLADKLPGIYLIETDPQGERSFHFWRSESAARYWLQGPKAALVCAALTAADFIYLSGISLAILSPEDRQLLIQVLADARNKGARIIFDNNYRPRLWQNSAVAMQVYQQVLKLTDIALLTLDDEDLIYGPTHVDEVIARTRLLGVTEVVIKRGASSCIIQSDLLRAEVAAEQVTSVVDTTAAGDSFGAAYIAARIAGRTPIEAAQAGHRLASTVIQHRGAIIARLAMPEHGTTGF